MRIVNEILALLLEDTMLSEEKRAHLKCLKSKLVSRLKGILLDAKKGVKIRRRVSSNSAVESS